ncbi:hypothetical protein KY363_01160 [Candidatus Woesearchaeota archaeon]|nr:hypothetical protein [Candidatus Woesearchaeota archaeon]
MNKVAQYTLGIFLIVLGVIGLFLPVLQGVLFIVLGIFVLREGNVSNLWQSIKDKTASLRKRN